MLPAGVNCPDLGSKSSADAVPGSVTGPKSTSGELPPPAISTLPLPSFSEVAVCPTRAVSMLPLVGVNIPVAGLKISAVARALAASFPPVIKTVPLVNKVAVCPTLAVSMLPEVEVNMPLEGLKISAVATGPVEFSPPTIKTVPSCSKVAVCPARGKSMLPAVGVKLPTGGAMETWMALETPVIVGVTVSVAVMV